MRSNGRWECPRCATGTERASKRPTPPDRSAPRPPRVPGKPAVPAVEILFMASPPSRTLNNKTASSDASSGSTSQPVRRNPQDGVTARNKGSLAEQEIGCPRLDSVALHITVCGDRSTVARAPGIPPLLGQTLRRRPSTRRRLLVRTASRRLSPDSCRRAVGKPRADPPSRRSTRTPAKPSSCSSAPSSTAPFSSFPASTTWPATRAR